MAGYVSSRALRLQSKAQSLTAIFHKELYNISSCGVAILAMIVSRKSDAFFGQLEIMVFYLALYIVLFSG